MPMVFSTSYGKGRILYTTALLGVAAWEMQRRPGDQMVPPPGARFRPFLDHMIAEAHPTVSHLRNVQSATPIVTNLHSIDEGDAARYVFHVLNAGGGRVAPGANVPRIVNASVWMNLTTPVHAEVQVPADYTAYAVSPDFEGRASLDVAPLGDGWSRVALPPNLLKRYSMIYFDPPTSGGVTE